MTKELKDIILAKCEENERHGFDMLTDSDLDDIIEEYERKGGHISYKELKTELDALIDKEHTNSLKHVTVVNNEMPIVVRFDEGYMRYWGALGVSKDTREQLAILGVSNMEAEPSTDYQRKEEEEITPLFGFVIRSKEDAEQFSKFFHMIADKWNVEA